MPMLKKIFLLTAIILLAIQGTAIAYWEIEYSEFLRNVMARAGNPLPKRVGRYNTKEGCKEAIKRAVRESGDPNLARNMYPAPGGYDEEGSSQTQQGWRKGGNSRWSISGPTNRTPEEEEMVGRARRTRNPRAALEAMKKEQQQKQLDERKEQQARAEFEQGKKEMLPQLKGGSGGEGLSLKGREGTLALKSGNVPATDQGAAKAIKDLRNSVYWSLEAANAASSGNYEPARESADFPNRPPGGKLQLPSVPDVPSPVSADPQVRLYQFLIKEVNQTTSELKLVNTNLEQAKEKKRKSEEKIDLQKTKIEELKIKTEELKQKKSECEKKDKQEGVNGLSAEAQALQKEQEEMDKLIAEARAAEAEAEEEDREAEKNLVSLNEQKKEQEENLSNLQQGFDTAEEHPERAENILKKFEGGKR